MADNYGKGSIIYKLLILILAAALVASIYYPKTLWDREARNTETCRYRISNLHNAELQYLRFMGHYTDSLEALIQFIKSDSSYRVLVDTSFAVPFGKLIDEFDSMKVKQAALATRITQISPLDSVAVLDFDKSIENMVIENRLIRDKMEFLREVLSTHPAAPISLLDEALAITGRKDFFLQFKIIENMVQLGNSQEALKANDGILVDYDAVKAQLRETIDALPQIFVQVDSLRYCPTVRKPIKLTVIDTSAIKFANVECPITEEDIKAVENNFMLSTIGALKIENHGKIDGGEKSWETRGARK